MKKKHLNILKNYSEGKIGWREAMASCEIFSYDDLQDLLKKNGLKEPAEVFDTKNVNKTVDSIVRRLKNL